MQDVEASRRRCWLAGERQFGPHIPQRRTAVGKYIACNKSVAPRTSEETVRPRAYASFQVLPTGKEAGGPMGAGTGRVTNRLAG